MTAALEACDKDPVAVAAAVQVHNLRIRALLTLAKIEAAAGAEASAIAAIDAAIRIARGEPLPVDEFGAKVVKLHDLRVSAPELRPAGTLHITCSVQCRVLLDGREAGRGSDVQVSGIPLGSHQLYVEPIDPAIHHQFQTDVLLSNGEPERAFDVTVPVATRPDDPPPDKKATPPKDGIKPRRLPRWAGILGIAVGAGLTVGGAVLLAVDGRCPGGGPTTGPNACSDLLDTLGVGAALTAIGGGTLIGFSVALGIGESRDAKRKKAKSTALMLNFRF